MTILDDRPIAPDPTDSDGPHTAAVGSADRPATMMPRAPRRRRRRRRILAVVALLLAVAMVPVGYSYGTYLTAPGDAPPQVRSVDWLRDHGFESVINDVEQWWYTRHKPTGSRPPKADIPVALRSGAAPGPSMDRAITASARPGALEGVWTTVDGLASRPGAVEQTYLHPDRAAPAVVADVVRFDQDALRTVYVPGTKEPGGKWAWGSQIPRSQRPRTVAAFNAGFKFRHTRGGVYTEGRHAVRPLQAGLASLVIGTDGRADVVAWPGEQALTPEVVSVRQNLALIVDGGRAVPGLASDRGGNWGTRRSQFQYTWRSAVGIDASGRLIYAAGHQMTLMQLARAMVDAGAVRAMQLDIHDGVISFNWYRPQPGAGLGVDASKLVPSMQRKATRYLASDQRDFIVVQAR